MRVRVSVLVKKNKTKNTHCKKKNNTCQKLLETNPSQLLDSLMIFIGGLPSFGFGLHDGLAILFKGRLVNRAGGQIVRILRATI